MLDVPRAVLVGSSSGGYVAQQVAVTSPDRVAGLVLVGSPLTLRGDPPFTAEIDRLSDPVRPDWGREFLAWFPLLHEVPDWYLDDRVNDATDIPARVWRASLAGLHQLTPPTEAGTVLAPTLILWGEADESTGRTDQQALATAIAGSALVTSLGVGHLVLWEQPDRVATDIARFAEAQSL
jgi:rifampin ADP-ribosylating transferase